MREPSPPRTGTTIGGEYTVGDLLGRGEMGEVYSAVSKDGTRVAIKFLGGELADDDAMVARFRREAEIAYLFRAARVAIPNVLLPLAAGKDRRGHEWICFPFLEGETLETRLARRHCLSFAEVHALVNEALTGLAAIHRVGVVHRDIKPANLFFEVIEPTGSERVRILDFGVARLAAVDDAAPLTTFGMVLGTPAYMAPEQERDAATVDGRTDLYAVGVVAFRALTGDFPFAGTSADALLAFKRARQPRRLSVVTSLEWPDALERFLQRIMSRDREPRFGDAATAITAWEALAPVANDCPPIAGLVERHRARAAHDDTDLAE